MRQEICLLIAPRPFLDKGLPQSVCNMTLGCLKCFLFRAMLQERTIPRTGDGKDLALEEPWGRKASLGVACQPFTISVRKRNCVQSVWALTVLTYEIQDLLYNEGNVWRDSLWDGKTFLPVTYVTED